MSRLRPTLRDLAELALDPAAAGAVALALAARAGLALAIATHHIHHALVPWGTDEWLRRSGRR